jgi:hypothetical protein
MYISVLTILPLCTKLGINSKHGIGGKIATKKGE